MTMTIANCGWGIDCMFCLRAWSTTLLRLIVGAWIIKQNNVLERWKFNLKMGVHFSCWMWFLEFWSIILFGLLCISFLEFLCLCLYHVPWTSFCVHIIAKKRLFALLCVSNFFLIIFLTEMEGKIWREKCLIIKNVDSRFPRNMVISVSSFPKTIRNLRFGKSYFAPWCLFVFFSCKYGFINISFALENSYTLCMVFTTQKIFIFILLCRIFYLAFLANLVIFLPTLLTYFLE